jgi:MSHA biogenesis protein MshE
MLRTKKIHIGKLLLEKNIITQEQLDRAIEYQKQSGLKLGQILVDFAIVDDEKLLQLLAEQLKIQYIDLKNYTLDQNIVLCLPEFYARRYRSIVLNMNEKGLLVGMADPQDVIAYDELSRILRRPFQIAVVNEVDLLNALDMTYRRTSEITSFAEELSEELKNYDYDITELGTGLSESDTPVVKLLQSLFEDAVQMNASDIHIEPDEKMLRIRLRIDGLLQEQILKEKSIGQALALRLKLLAGLNIAEKRLPQDGRFSIRIKNKNFDVRLSTVPIQFGESIVMRLLDQSGALLDLAQTGMPENILRNFRKVVALPYGLVLIVGPTGSGKTTTLYGALNEINKPDIKIITAEDPVEYRLPRINQVQIQPKIDLTFAKVLRSILRQDPDVILVGELRDEETVSIALRAALTGHLVLATLHTNDAITSAIRLMDMGAPGYLVASVLHAVMAQRLLRKICSRCSEDYQLTAQEISWVNSAGHFSLDKMHFKQGKGCAFCHYTGYKGRIGVYEYLEMGPALADALRGNEATKFNHLAVKEAGFRPMIFAGMDLVKQGITTVNEVMTVIGENILLGQEKYANI